MGLYDDARFPGRCILAFHEHIEDFAELDSKFTVRFVNDAQKAGKAIKEALLADRINYAILGNVAPHLHMHLIPRKRNADLIPNQSPWKHSNPCSKLPENERNRIMEAILYALDKN